MAFRTCPLCEAGCGLEITLKRRSDGTETVQRIRGDRDDVFSAGFLCPKGTTLGHLHDDPDRLRRPLVRRDGELVEATWEEAFAAVEAGLAPLLDRYGRDACAIYLGNPGAHSLGPLFYNRNLVTALATTNRYSAGSVDQRPKEVSTALMFGSVAVPVPDLDRTDFVVLLGANPYASNGSLCTAPDFPGRLEGIQARGGTVVVVDPRRSETAGKADRHLAIRPGTDAHLLAAVAHVLLADGLADPGRLTRYTNGLDGLPAVVAPFTPDAVAPVCGIEAAAITRLAHDLAAAPTAAVYGRIGTCTQEFGTLASWLVDVVNLLTGNLDRIGGAMFPTGAVGHPSTKGRPGTGRGMRIGRAASRVAGRMEAMGEFPVSALAEEIETPGEGQIRGLITVAGNPVSSNPEAERLDVALASLEFMVSIDIYLNETTRHADVILPVPSPLQKSHYDLSQLNFAVRNVANYSPAVLPLDEDQPEEWEILLRVAALVEGRGVGADLAAMDDEVALRMAASSARDSYGNVAGRDPAELVAATGDRRGPERLLDIRLRTGPYGDGFGADPDGLTLGVLEAHPHGVDLGPLRPDRVPDLLRTPSGRIELLPEPIVADVDRLVASLDRDHDGLVLVGRRHVRSNNSWMHNLRVLTKGQNRCTLQIHPDDADRLGLVDGAPATVRSRVGEVIIDAELTDAIRPGVVSIPHGFGQNLPGVRLKIAQEYRGVNTNVLTDTELVDAASGTIALNGVPVTVAPA
ncbi:MAG: molybdopterin-dependent oxidoreductase [Acidimicrobiales bacterium]